MKRAHQASAAFVLFFAVAAAIVLFVARNNTVPPEIAARNGVVSPAGFFVNTMKSEEYYREQIARNPKSAGNYVKLAQLQLQMARQTGDELRYIPEAKSLVSEALHWNPNDYTAHVLEATILNAQHRFDEAAQKLDALIRANPHHAYLRGAMVDALVETGRYDEAIRQSDTMQTIRPGLSSYARAAYLRELHGDNGGAIAAMRMAANAGAIGSPDRAWALYQYGMLMLRTGKTAAAEEIFNGIIEERPDYSMALVGIAATALAEDRYSEALEIAINGYEATRRIVFLEQALEARMALGETDLSDEIATIKRSFHDAEDSGEIIDMEYADFLADHEMDLGEALQRIEREVTRRPDHLHVIETHAWVLHKLGRSGEALATVRKAMRLGRKDAKLYYRASIIADSAGAKAEARQWRMKALRYNLKNESVTSWMDLRERMN